MLKRLVDIERLNGPQATGLIYSPSRKIPIVMTVTSFDVAAVRPALQHGAKGCIAKPELGEQLVPGVRAVYDDGTA